MHRRQSVRFFLLFTMGLGWVGCKSTDPQSAVQSEVKTDVVEESRRLMNEMFDQNQSNKIVFSERSRKNRKAYDIHILTLNFGLLEDPASSQTTAFVPKYDERRKMMKSFLEPLLTGDKAVHFIGFQEVFYKQDRMKLEEVLKGFGYGLSYIDDGNSNQLYGTMIAYRKNNLMEVQPFQKNAGGQRTALADEDFGHVQRSLYTAVFTLKNGTPEGLRVLVGSTHLSYAKGKAQNEKRMQQISLLTSVLERRAKEVGAQVSLLAADMNLSPFIGPVSYCPKLTSLDNSERDQWRENVKGYNLMARKFRDMNGTEVWPAIYNSPDTSLSDGNFIVSDTYGSSDASRIGYTQNPDRNPIALEGPTTCNEPAQRLDYVWVAAPDSSLKYKYFVKEASLALDKPLDGLFASDHFGVRSTISFFPNY